MSDHVIQWASAAPLWREAAATGNIALSRPALLRFASDDFMDAFMQVLESQPERLGEYRAWPETWRDPLPQPQPVASLPPVVRALARRRAAARPSASQTVATAGGFPNDSRPLKLFQPAHQRYYMVAACLICRTAGLPDRALDTGNAERVSFVVRRLLPKASAKPPARPTAANLGEYDEYALVNGGGAAGSRPAWQLVIDAQKPATGEEQNPLFPVSYIEADGRRRRIFGGLVPVAKREAYLGAGKADTTAGGSATATALPAAGGADPRLVARLLADFIEPWKQMIDAADQNVRKMNYDRGPVDDRDKAIAAQTLAIQALRYQIQEASWLLLLDLATFLHDVQLTAVLDALKPSASAVALPGSQQPVYDALVATKAPATFTNGAVASSLGDALARIGAYSKQLEGSLAGYPDTSRGTVWPDFLFPLTDLAESTTGSDPKPVLLTIAQQPGTPDLSEGLAEGLKKLVDKLGETIAKALPAETSQRLTPVPLAAQVPLRADDPGWFLIRCVFERPNCLPEPAPIVSEATDIFQMAGFFDPDAPARPIRIQLPMDTTPAGLRKFDKNTAFMISDVLCGQIKRAKGLGLGDLVRSVLPWPLHKELKVSDSGSCQDGGGAFGMICSLSIPIITICALILLMIIVSLLDIIFKWIPFFIMCFPLPKFKGKETTT